MANESGRRGPAPAPPPRPRAGGAGGEEKLGELLLRERKISLEQLKQAQDEQKRSGTNLGYTLARLGYVSDEDISKFLAQQYNIPAVNLSDYDIDPEIIALIPKEVAQRHKVIPVQRAGSSLIVAMADPTNLHAIDDIKFLTAYNVEPVVASEPAIQAAIEKYYEKGISYTEALGDVMDLGEIEVREDEEGDVNVLELEKLSEDAPVVRLVNLLLINAIRKGASDIHVEPYEKFLRVRYRVDGVLLEEMQPPKKMQNAICSRLKIMSSLDIAERRLPQDGRIKLRVGKDKEMDFRVSVLPTLFGEKVVLRLLDKSSLQLDMTKLGFEPVALEHFRKAIYMPYGMCLVTGPTGSGKTTTLYSALSELNRPSHNISTAEDPVEYNLPGINQVQMHDEIGLNFAASLRSFLRQDPDIIMVGEIRDFETAEIGIKAALTGHLVLSTLHTNDAPSSISRLLNMGIEPFLVTASINLILAQRLVRKNCGACGIDDPQSPKVLLDAGFTEDEMGQLKLKRGRGCRECSNTGYRGRIALYEVMPFSEDLKEMVLQGASTAELKAQAVRDGMTTLRRAGLNKVKEGMSSIEEVLRVTAMD
ncbi:MAG: type IV-A pilus assembly ATPase PilB [Deltaproteobacteria bacterium]|nr:type IV-A pilus assembly ATPase PilB [Deltaproteobacteria bacterium]